MPDRDTAEFARTLGQVIDAHFSRRAGVLEQVAAGAAFEQWFALEARLAVEAARPVLDLHQKVSCDGRDVWRHWTANEHRKVDLYIGDYRGGADATARCLVGIEFKLIHNNKNWTGKCSEVLADLAPTKRKKAAIKPALGWLAIPIFIYKTYWDASIKYPVTRHPTSAAFIADVEDALAPAGDVLYQSPPRTLQGEYLEPGSHLEFRIYGSPQA